MTLSTITPITFEGQPLGLSSFTRAGVMYVFWRTFISDTGFQRLHWKPHTGANFTEVTPALPTNFSNAVSLYHPASDQLVVVWDDGGAEFDVRDGNLYTARFNVLTGALVSGLTLLFPGSKPKLAYRASAGSECSLYYVTAKAGGVYGRLSTDGGVTWQSGEPLVTNQVRGTKSVEVIPFDSEHVSIAQLGGDARPLSEIGMFARTRPLASIVKHPTLAGQFFVSEPSKFDNVTLVDNLRGGLALSTDNTKLFNLDGARQGTDDGVAAVARLTVTGTAVAVTASAGPTGNGDDFNEYTLTPAAGALNVDLPGTSYAVDLALSAAHAYIAEYADNSATAGQLAVVDLSGGATGTAFSGIAAVRAVGVANFLAPPLIFAATTESGVERLRVYAESGLAPVFVLSTKLPSRANAVRVVPHPTAPLGARLLVSLVDRFNIYDYDATHGLSLVDSYRFAGGGQFFRTAVASNGNIVVAAGNAGVLLLNPTGGVRAQLRVSGKRVSEWKPSTAYALNALVRPRDDHPFARNRYYFKVTTVGAGLSGSGEPAWATSGIVYDPISPPTAGNTNSLQWTPVAVTDGVAVDVVLDESLKQIYAVGSAGGDLGTDGRVWILNAAGLL